jgi:hypothetical protein
MSVVADLLAKELDLMIERAELRLEQYEINAARMKGTYGSKQLAERMQHSVKRLRQLEAELRQQRRH